MDNLTNTIHSIGGAVADDVDRRSVASPEGTRAVWPLKPDGTEMLWGLTPEVLRRNWKNGFVRVSKKGTVQYLQTGTILEIADGTIEGAGRGKDGSVQGTKPVDDETPTPKRVWNVPSHNAEAGGTRILSRLIPGRRFPYPKSLYGVEDVLRFFVGSKPDAIVLDFFAGSGTTAHAVMRLNRQDAGRRQCICITNNEVSPHEEVRFREKGLRPGDAEWEQWGIFEYITKPRLKVAITGATRNGASVEGEYEYTDNFPLADGLAENVEFFAMTYEAPRPVAHNRAFEALAPLLWLRAGSQGRRIEKARDDFDVADTYAVLFDLDASQDFLAALAKAQSVRIAFIVTDDDRGFQMVCGELPAPGGSRAPVRVVPHQLHDQHGAGRLASMEVAGGVLTHGDHRRGQDGDGGGSCRGAVRRQLGLRLRFRPRRGGAVVHRRPVAQRADPVPSAGRRRPDRPLALGGDREHLQPGETRTGQGLLPQCPEAGEEVAPGQESTREFSRGT